MLGPRHLSARDIWHAQDSNLQSVQERFSAPSKAQGIVRKACSPVQVAQRMGFRMCMRRCLLLLVTKAHQTAANLSLCVRPALCCHHTQL